MAYQVLARKWRPKTFQELTGQEHVSTTIENAIKTKRIAHAYLFSGVRGVGKTTVARILAKSLNCSEGPTPIPCMTCQSCKEITGGYSVDVIEIDGASHTGVDNIRELQESAQYSPLRGHYKIYIIDEVHMLSTSAFNALLKILEEPPSHIVFIFATTEPHKIPATIHSRCQHFQFRRISYREIMERLRYILQEEGIKAGEAALSVVVRASDGSMRDALSLLDQVIACSGDNINEEDVTWILGLAGHLTDPFIRHILNKDAAGALNILKDVSDGGYDLKQFLLNVVEQLRNLMMIKLGIGQDVIDLPAEKIEVMAKMADGAPLDDVQRLFGIFSDTLEEMRWFPFPRFSLEMAAVKAANIGPVVPVDDLLLRLRDMERRLTSGANHADKNRVKPDIEDGIVYERIQLGEDIRESGQPSAVNSQQVSDSGDQAIISRPQTAGKPYGDSNSGTDLKSIWGNIVRGVIERKPSLGSYIEQGVPVGVDDGVLNIGFNGGASVFINLLDRKDSKDLILQVVRNYIQGVSGIRFTTVSGKNGNSPAYDEYVATTHEKQQEEIDDAFTDPIVQKAIDILGGELVELRSRKGE